jgi:hypothetical protein
MQSLYWSIVGWQAFWGSAAAEKSMHSSRLAFSSLHTQQGCLVVWLAGMVSEVLVAGQRTLGFEAASVWAGAAEALEPRDAGIGQPGLLETG